MNNLAQMTKSQVRQKLVDMQNAIKYESDEDEGAMEYYGEIQSVIDVIDAGGNEAAIKKAADWVGISIMLEV